LPSADKAQYFPAPAICKKKMSDYAKPDIFISFCMGAIYTNGDFHHVAVSLRDVASYCQYASCDGKNLKSLFWPILI
jgi:hypothetical protein